MSEVKKKEESWLNVFRDMDKRSVLALAANIYLVHRLLFQNLIYTVLAAVLVIATSFFVIAYETWRLKNRRAPKMGILV